MTGTIEAGFQAGKQRLDVDAERFIDYVNLLQRRKDDESKRRPVKREIESNDPTIGTAPAKPAATTTTTTTTTPSTTTTTTTTTTPSTTTSTTTTPTAMSDSEDDEEEEEEEEDEEDEKKPAAKKDTRAAVGDAKVGYAASSRAACRICRDNIVQESLRIARLVQSPNL